MLTFAMYSEIELLEFSTRLIWSIFSKLCKVLCDLTYIYFVFIVLYSLPIIPFSALLIALMIGAQTAFAAELKDAPFSKHPMADIISGLAIGAQDAKDSCYHPDGCHWWILMRGHGARWATPGSLDGNNTTFWTPN